MHNSTPMPIDGIVNQSVSNAKSVNYNGRGRKGL